MKFDMGTTTLSTLHTQTTGSNNDLTALVRQLVAAAEPLEGKFSGGGRQAFDTFKSHSDQVCSDLNSALVAIVGVQSGMDNTFNQGDRDFSDNASKTQSGADFDGAKFQR